MGTVVVPLAGPDFYSDRFGIRPLYPVGTTTLLEYVLCGRPWLAPTHSDKWQVIFVLREEEDHTQACRRFLDSRFPSADVVTLSRLTAGACLSALAGTCLSVHHESPLVIDLADIAFSSHFDPSSFFQAPDNVGVAAVIPYFESTNPKFSYLRLQGSRVLEAREKNVISSHASAGVYIFRDTASYLEAAAYCIRTPAVCQVGGASFVCPSVNGLIAVGRSVEGILIDDAEPISELFH